MKFIEEKALSAGTEFAMQPKTLFAITASWLPSPRKDNQNNLAVEVAKV